MKEMNSFTRYVFYLTFLSGLISVVFSDSTEDEEYWVPNPEVELRKFYIKVKQHGERIIKTNVLFFQHLQ